MSKTRPPEPTAPDAPEHPVVLREHGRERIDPYHWLRDDERSHPEVLAYLEAENRYTEKVLEPFQSLRQNIYREIVDRIRPDDSDVPVRIDDYWYYARFQAGQEYPLYARRRGSPDGPEEIILDENRLAEGHEFYKLGSLEVSDDHRLLAFAEDTVSRRLYTIRIRDLDSGEFLPDRIENSSGAIAWAADNQTLFYVRKDPDTLLPYQVWRHRIGTPASSDVLVYEEPDSTFYTTVYRGKSRDYVYIHVGSTLSDEVHLLKADDPDGEFRVFLPRRPEHEYSVDDVDGRFFVLSNLDAPNYRLLETRLADAGEPSKWVERIAHREDALIHDIELFRDYLVVNEREDGLRKLRVLPLGEGAERRIEADEPAYAMYIDDNEMIDSQLLRYGYSSPNTPYSIYEIDLRSGERTLLKREPVEGDFDPADYATERFRIEARDGTAVPVSLVYRKPFRPDGSRPLLIYGYGAYGSSSDPVFSLSRLSLLDRGFVFAIAHVRGGQELGRSWYEQGRMHRKMNSFTDFIDVTRALVDRGYGDPQRVYAYGGSAGGLLVGAVINMAPELYHGVIAAVPFVDVVTTMLDEGIPLTTGEFDEWGNPKNPAEYETMLAYSPYDQVRAQDYPNLLVTTGLHDSQVQYWEPAKWVAKLRDLKTDDRLLLLYTDLESGHGGASGRYKQYEDTALMWTFLLMLSGEATPSSR